MNSHVFRFLVCYILASVLQAVTLPFNSVHASPHLPMHSIFIIFGLIVEPIYYIYEFLKTFRHEHLGSISVFIVAFFILWFLLRPNEEES